MEELFPHLDSHFFFMFVKEFLHVMLFTDISSHISWFICNFS